MLEVEGVLPVMDASETASISQSHTNARKITYHISMPSRGIKERHGSWLAVVVMLNALVLGSTPCRLDKNDAVSI